MASLFMTVVKQQKGSSKEEHGRASCTLHLSIFPLSFLSPSQSPIWYGCQPRINNLRQRPDLGGGLVTHVACMIGKCGNEGSRSEVPALLVLSTTVFPAYSDSLGTREKCHCNQVSL